MKSEIRYAEEKIKESLEKLKDSKTEDNNLWKYDLPKGWRLLYSVAGSEVCVLSIVLEWTDHKNYERRFNY